MLDQIPDAKPALALRRAQVPRGQDPAEPAVSRAIPWIDERVRRAVDECETRAGNDPHPRHRLGVLARVGMRAHDAGERVAVGDPDSRKPELGCARNHLLGMRGPAEKGEIRHHREFSEPRLKPDQGRRSSCERNGQIGPQTTRTKIEQSCAEAKRG
jgi:hypothetical protein